VLYVGPLKSVLHCGYSPGFWEPKTHNLTHGGLGARDENNTDIYIGKCSIRSSTKIDGNPQKGH